MADNFINKAISKIRQIKGSDKLLVFTIASTSKQETEPFLSPVREFEKFNIFGCVLFSQSTLLDLLAEIDGIVDVVLVDAEKKIPLKLGDENPLREKDARTIGFFETGNFAKVCLTKIKKSRVFEYKPNDITVDAAWMFLSQKLQSFSGRKVSILGLGNIGSKLALKLVECGADVHVYSRDFYKTHLITQALNLIKPVGTIASITCHRQPLSASFASDVIIGVTNGHPVITKEVVTSVNKKCLVIDLGKNNISKDGLALAQEYNLEVCRTDVTSALELFVLESLSLSKLLSDDYGERDINGDLIVGGGYFGQDGMIVLDSISAPTQLLGVADGAGSLKTVLTVREQNAVERVSRHFDLR
ncbi:NAD(P)-binding domain-containing protein [Gammaproteobacteria bacterium]|nr:NAD(P)-binding domain-containing protein [Gammaproteobacteria bacterium]